MSRTNTLVPISFGRDETQLLELLDKGRKEKCMSRSGWVKQKIREEFGSEKLQTV
jgi:hypothetical protein|tara:strand:- start:518 stop:682 length:165 start_codon:yes stop_codon:yes gene_type:complete